MDIIAYCPTCQRAQFHRMGPLGVFRCVVCWLRGRA